MSEHEHKNDPWADLAESLGAKPVAKPADEPASRPAASTPSTPARPPQKPREVKPASAPRSDWGDLASSLGLEPSKEPPATPPPSRPQPIAAQAPRASVEPPPRRGDRDQDEFSFGSRRPAAEPSPRQDRESARTQRHDANEPLVPSRSEATAPSRPVGERADAESRDRSDSGAPSRGARDDDQADGRGRRRRGRRGGRGRGRRDENRDRPVPGRLDDEQASDRWPAEAADHDGFDEPRDVRPEGAGNRAGLPAAGGVSGDAIGDDDGGPRSEPAGDGDRDADGAPRRRRRRGRRGGRRRGRGDREGDVAARPQADRDGGEQPRDAIAESSRFADHDADHDADDEPLPAGYGMRPAVRPATDGGRSDASRREGGESSGTARADDRESGDAGGRRRRRRRRGGEGRGREGRGTAVPAEGSTSRRSSEGGGRRGRRDRRSTSEESRSASTFDRGRRDEFAPVAGGRDEDDEGLEFLGVEDASQDGHGRGDRHPADDDDSIVESGLNEVLDVPSWVEAIGIVIAGNLDARSRSPRTGDGGRGGESRGDAPARGGSSDRPREGRRGGRSGNQR